MDCETEYAPRTITRSTNPSMTEFLFQWDFLTQDVRCGEGEVRCGREERFCCEAEESLLLRFFLFPKTASLVVFAPPVLKHTSNRSSSALQSGRFP